MPELQCRERAVSKQDMSMGPQEGGGRCSKEFNEERLPEPAPSWVANRVVIPAARSMMDGYGLCKLQT